MPWPCDPHPHRKSRQAEEAGSTEDEDVRRREMDTLSLYLTGPANPRAASVSALLVLRLFEDVVGTWVM